MRVNRNIAIRCDNGEQQEEVRQILASYGEKTLGPYNKNHQYDQLRYEEDSGSWSGFWGEREPLPAAVVHAEDWIKQYKTVGFYTPVNLP